MATKQEWLDAVDPDRTLVPREGEVEASSVETMSVPPVGSVLTAIIHQEGEGRVVNGAFVVLNSGPVPRTNLPFGMDLRLDLKVTGIAPELPVEKRLAYEVLFGEADAVWPLIDAILEARERSPALPRLSVRARKLLCKLSAAKGGEYEVPSPEVVSRMKADDLFEIKGCGFSVVQEVRDWLKAAGLKFVPSEGNYSADR